jgi:hypothetical protein
VELHYQQELFGRKLLFDIGWEPLGMYFAMSPLWCSFFQTLATCGTVSINSTGTWQDWPFGQWGARVRYQPSAKYHFSTGVYRVNPANFSKGFDLTFGLTFGGTGVIAPFEFGWLPGQGDRGMPGEYKLGGYYDSSPTGCPNGRQWAFRWPDWFTVCSNEIADALAESDDLVRPTPIVERGARDADLLGGLARAQQLRGGPISRMIDGKRSDRCATDLSRDQLAKTRALERGHCETTALCPLDSANQALRIRLGGIKDDLLARVGAKGLIDFTWMHVYAAEGAIEVATDCDETVLLTIDDPGDRRPSCESGRGMRSVQPRDAFMYIVE